MVTQITLGIKISVHTSFEGTYIKNGKLHGAGWQGIDGHHAGK